MCPQISWSSLHPRHFFAQSPILAAALLMIISCLFYSASNAAARLASHDLHPFQIALFRSLITFGLLLPLLIRQPFWRMDGNRFRKYLGRASLSAASMLTWYWAIAHEPLADVVALSFTTPLFMTLLAALILKEAVGIRRWSATILGFIGALIIIQPDPETFSPGAWIALISSGFSAVGLLLVKSLTRNDSAWTIVGTTALLVAFITALPAIWVWHPLALEHLPLIGLVGVLGLGAQLLLTQAFSLADASAVMPYDYTRLIFASAFGYLLFDEWPGSPTWAGAAIIIAATLYIAYREAQLRKRKRSPPEGRAQCTH